MCRYTYIAEDLICWEINYKILEVSLQLNKKTDNGDAARKVLEDEIDEGQRINRSINTVRNE